jgi:organic hydroperoxide reductase OsmC/OhrA
MSDEPHRYTARLTWDGNRGVGTTSYTTYGRDYHVAIEGKPDLAGSADPTFRGDPALHNPEDLFLIAISSCHLLTYLALCAKHRVNVIAYTDHATGTMELDRRGGGRFTEVVLHPTVTLAPGADRHRAASLHEEAHALCFIANSCSVPIRHEATIVTE